MIRKLKYKFVILAMTALFALLLAIVTGMNIINYTSVVKESDSVLSLLTQNRGKFPETVGRPNDKLPPKFSPETPYESRYFTVFFNKANDITDVDIRKIASVDKEKAIELAEKIIEENKIKGFVGEYRYMTVSDPNGMHITFLDCGRRLDSFHRFLISSVVMSTIGLAIVLIVILILSDRIIRPIAEAYEKQKQFITDAGHEIKTPLTVINANVDILETELGEDNESLGDIKVQVKRLKTLTEDLVMLSRMEEAENKLQKIEFPISEVVMETADAFRTLAENENKEFICTIEPMLTFNGNDKAIRQLVSVFLDNALKYSQNGGRIELTLARQNRTIILSVFNTTDFEINSEQLKYVFDRFYRTDASRNSESGGHGIGLSVAKAIVTNHSGKINAATKDGKSFLVTAYFPI